jgi:hypothetical protein
MDDTTISAALDAAGLALSQGDSHAARRHIAAARAASDQTLETEYRAWFRREYGHAPALAGHGVKWGRYLLRGGGMPHNTAACGALAIPLAVAALVVSLVWSHSLWGLSFAAVPAAVAVLICPWPWP